MEKGWDPEVKRFFLKIAKSVSLGLTWLMVCLAGGLYFKLAYTGGGTPLIYVILFYIFSLVTFVLLLRYLYNLWQK